MFGKRKQKRCDSILRDIITTEEMLGVYCRRVKDSIMQNEGNMMQVYQEISYVISKDYNEKNMDICSRVSLAIVTMIRMSSYNYKDLEFKYHG